MKKSNLLALASVLFVSLFTVSACAGIISHDETLRYKMTVTISTPEGDKVGSAVKEATKHTEKSISPEQGGTSYQVTKGEAVVIDLGPRGKVFALQDSENEARQVFQANAAFNPPPDKYPIIVFFKNTDNPASVQIAQANIDCEKHGGKCMPRIEGASVDKLGNLGREIYIKKIETVAAQGPITHDIEKILPWLREFDNKQLDGNKYWYLNAENKTANALSAGNFLVR